LADDRLYPLQLVLRGLLGGGSGGVLRMAAIVLSSLPIILLALSLQKYFTRGVLLTGVRVGTFFGGPGG
jgi:ABC-type glycerol-3-phosphate transport system permease component